MLVRTQGMIAAIFFVLAEALEGGMAARSESSEVAFAAEFPAPLLAGGALTAAAETSIHVALRISNRSGRALRFSTYRSVLPELLDAAGAVVPFDYGANRSPGPSASNYPLLPPGQSLVVALDGTMQLHKGEIDWRGSQGILGYWKVTPTAGPYRFRLHYLEVQATAGPFDDQTEVLSGVWTGEAVTDAVGLPVKFAQ